MTKTMSAGHFAFPAMLAGSACLAFGPWLVRLADVGPLATGFWRLAIATPLMLLACGVVRAPIPRLDFRLLGVMALAGAAFAFDLGSWHEGIVRTRLANATLIGNATAFIFAAWGFLVSRQLPGRETSIALGLALLGVILLMGQSYQLSPRNLTGDLLCLLSAVFYTVYLIAVGAARGRVAPLPTLALATAFGAMTALVVALLGEGNIWPHDWTPLIVLAVSSQLVGQGLVVYAVAYLEPVVAGLCLLIQPVIAGTVGWAIYGEHLGPLEFLGATMIAVALLLVRRRDRSGSLPDRDGLRPSAD